MAEPEIEPEIPLPPLQEAVLDEDTLDRLFFDIAEAAELVSVSLKAGATARAGDLPRARRGSDELALARRALGDGTALGVQIRYRFAGSEWWDTLLRMPSGVRLVRVRIEDAL